MEISNVEKKLDPHLLYRQLCQRKQGDNPPTMKEIELLMAECIAGGDYIVGEAAATYLREKRLTAQEYGEIIRVLIEAKDYNRAYDAAVVLKDS